MIRNVIIVVFLLAAVIYAATPVPMPAPGSTGMQTDIDAADLRLTDASYLLNTDITNRRGVLKKRSGHVPYGAAPGINVWAAVGIYDPFTKWKGAAYIEDTVYVPVTGFDTGSAGAWGAIVDSLYVSTPDSQGVVRFTGEGAIAASGSADWWVDRSAYHDFTQTPDGIVYANPHAPLGLITLTSQATTYDTTIDSIFSDSVWFYDTLLIITITGPNPTYDTLIDSTLDLRDTVVINYLRIQSDSVIYDPRIIPVSPNAPGSLRGFAFDSVSGGGITGTFQYFVYFPSAELAHYNDVRSITVDDGAILLTKFPRDPTPTNDSTIAIIARRNVETGQKWMVLDTIRYANSATVQYLDKKTGLSSSVDIDEGLTIYTGGYTTTMGSVLRDVPGAIRAYTTDTVVGGVTAGVWYNDTIYYFAYSLIDTLTMLESPLSIPTRIPSPSVAGTRLVAKFGYSGGPQAIRIYRTLAQGSDVFAPLFNISQTVRDVIDDLTFYAVQDVPVEGWAGVVSVSLGNFTDSSLINGDAIVDAVGAPITRPPVIAGNPSSMTDAEYWNDRLWAIGDNEFPSRLWYSADGEYESWPGLSYLDLDEYDNDILVAIEKISVGNAEALLAFKRQKTFIIYGSLPSDVEFLNQSLWGSFADVSTDAQIGDLTVSILAQRTGAIDRRLVVKHGNSIYAVTNDLEVIRFSGTKLDTLSRPVWSQLKNVLTSGAADEGGGRDRQQSATSYSSADVVGSNAMIHGDEVLFISSGSNVGMAWNTVSQTWSTIDFGFGGTPIGTFRYDTVATPELFGGGNDLIFCASNIPFYLQEDSVSSDSITTAPFKMAYRSPLFQDNGYDICIQSVKISCAGSGPTVTLRAINENGDTLATNSFVAGGAYGNDFEIGMPRHSSVGLVLSVEASATDGDFVIYELTPNIKRVGRNRIK